MVGNQLRILPPEIGQLTNLRVLAADSNQLTILPGAGGKAGSGRLDLCAILLALLSCCKI